MVKLKCDDYGIEIFTSAIEWGKEFYDLPDNAVLL